MPRAPPTSAYISLFSFTAQLKMNLEAWLNPGKIGKTSGKGVRQAAYPTPPNYQAGGGSVKAGIRKRFFRLTLTPLIRKRSNGEQGKRGSRGTRKKRKRGRRVKKCTASTCPPFSGSPTSGNCSCPFRICRCGKVAHCTVPSCSCCTSSGSNSECTCCTKKTLV